MLILNSPDVDLKLLLSGQATEIDIKALIRTVQRTRDVLIMIVDDVSGQE